MAAEFPIGPLAGSRQFADFVGNTDLSDVYSFTLPTVSELQISLTNRTQSAGIDLYLDINNNDVSDSGENITGS